MFGGGGLDPRKMEQMMEQMGIEMDEYDATEVIIRLEEGTELVFGDPEVTRMDAQGQQTYQVVGEPEERDVNEGTSSESSEESAPEPEPSSEESGAIPDADVELVMERTGVTEEAARAALEELDGDLAGAISALE